MGKISKALSSVTGALGMGGDSDKLARKQMKAEAAAREQERIMQQNADQLTEQNAVNTVATVVSGADATVTDEGVSNTRRKKGGVTLSSSLGI